jgi:hypothetical protein
MRTLGCPCVIVTALVTLGMSHMAEYTCCSSVAFGRPKENAFTFTFTLPSPLCLGAQSQRGCEGQGCAAGACMAKHMHTARVAGRVGWGRGEGVNTTLRERHFRHGRRRVSNFGIAAHFPVLSVECTDAPHTMLILCVSRVLVQQRKASSVFLTLHELSSPPHHCLDLRCMLTCVTLAYTNLPFGSDRTGLLADAIRTRGEAGGGGGGTGNNRTKK